MQTWPLTVPLSARSISRQSDRRSRCMAVGENEWSRRTVHTSSWPLCVSEAVWIASGRCWTLVAPAGAAAAPSAAPNTITCRTRILAQSVGRRPTERKLARLTAPRKVAGCVRRTPAVGILWNWQAAALGALYALPAGVVVLSDRSRGLALAVGVLPAAIVGLMPSRRDRLAIPVLGTSIGVPMFIGGLLAEVPVLAVVAIAALGIGSALLAARVRLGQVAMTLSLPMVGVGLSYPNLGKAAGVAGLMVLGSLFACFVSMFWPEHAPASSSHAAPAPGSAEPTLGYGIRLGAAGATAAALGFLLDLEHVGWACAAALLVMRPGAEMQRLRSVGRVIAVAVGALAAIALVKAGPPPGVYSAAAIVAVAGAGGTHRSRWYVTPAFTTFLVFLLLLYSRPSDAASRFNERLLETLLGVGLAYLFGLALPALTRRVRTGERSGQRGPG